MAAALTVPALAPLWRSHGGAVRALGYRGQRMVSPVTSVPRRAVVGDRASPHLLVPHLPPIHVECDCDSIRSSGVNGERGAMRNRLSVCRPGDLSAAKEVGVVLTPMTDTDAVPVFPAASCATALIVCEPLA